jgi:hypothetical protein
MKKRLIVVQSVFDKIEDFAQSINSMRYAAHRWNTDFLELSYHKFPNSINKIFWDRNWVYKNFINYDEVLLLDPDAVVNSKAPNLFDELSEFDFAVVRDGNPDGRFSDAEFLKRSIVKNISHLDNCVDLFDRYIYNFDYKNYWDGYFNNGVVLFKTSSLQAVVDELENLIYDNNEIQNYLKTNYFSCQNLPNAFITSSKLKIKYLDSKWNWIIPDLAGKNGYLKDQFIPETGDILYWEDTMESPPDYSHNLFRGSMKPYIYHFTGTSESKNILKNYTNWK